MISIMKYMSGADAHGVWIRALQLVFESLRLRVLDVDTAAADEYRARLARLQEGLDDDISPERALMSAGAFATALEDFNRQIERLWKGQSHEMQASTLVQVAEHARQSADGLKSVQTEIEHAANLDDIRELKKRLEDTLKTIKAEMERHENRTATIQGALSETVASLRQTPAPRAGQLEVDPVTGLDGPKRAEAAIRGAIGQSEPWFATLFCIDRIERIAARFGCAVGDEVMTVASQHVAQRLTGEDQLFRWRGASLLALFKRDLNAAKVRQEMARLAPQRIEHLVKQQDRSVLLPVNATWLTLELRTAGDIGNIIRELETFRSTLAGGGHSCNQTLN